MRDYCSVELSKELHKLLNYHFIGIVEQYWHNYEIIDAQFERVKTIGGYDRHINSYLDMSTRLQSISIPDDAEEYPAYTIEELGHYIREHAEDCKDIIEFKNSVMSYNEVDERAKILINILKRKK